MGNLNCDGLLLFTLNIQHDAAVAEEAVDIRGAELRCVPSSMRGILALQIIPFPNATSRHLSRLVREMLEARQVYLNRGQQKAMRQTLSWMKSCCLFVMGPVQATGSRI